MHIIEILNDFYYLIIMMEYVLRKNRYDINLIIKKMNKRTIDLIWEKNETKQKNF